MSDDAPASLRIQEVTLETQGGLRTEWLRLRHALWNDEAASLASQLDQLAQARVIYFRRPIR